MLILPGRLDVAFSEFCFACADDEGNDNNDKGDGPGEEKGVDNAPSGDPLVQLAVAAAWCDLPNDQPGVNGSPPLSAPVSSAGANSKLVVAKRVVAFESGGESGELTAEEEHENGDEGAYEGSGRILSRVVAIATQLLVQ